MLIHFILFALGLQVMFSEHAYIDCNHPNNPEVIACYYEEAKVIMLDYNDPAMGFHLRHESCHALKLQDNLELKEYVATLPPTRYYPPHIYFNEDLIVNEKLADYCAMHLEGTLDNDKLNKMLDKLIWKRIKQTNTL